MEFRGKKTSATKEKSDKVIYFANEILSENQKFFAKQF